MFFRIPIFHLSQKKVLLYCVEYLNICCQVNISVYSWDLTLAFNGEGEGKEKEASFQTTVCREIVSCCLTQHVLEPTGI